MSEHAPEPDQDQDEAGRQNDGRDHQVALTDIQARNRSMMTLSSQPTLMPSKTESSGIAPALKNAPNWPSGSTRLSRKPPATINPATPTSTKSTPAIDSVMLRKSRSSRCCGISEQQQQHARRDHRPALKASACGQMTVHDDIGRKYRRSAAPEFRAPVRTISLACRGLRFGTILVASAPPRLPSTRPTPAATMNSTATSPSVSKAAVGQKNAGDDVRRAELLRDKLSHSFPPRAAATVCSM